MPHEGRCVAHSNYPGSCVKCGRLLPERDNPAPVRAVSAPDCPVRDMASMVRDRAHERSMITTAARAWRVDGSVVADLADARAHEGPVRTEGRDLAWEAVEEAADGCNYVVWLMLWLAIHRPEDHQAGEALAHLGQALGAFVFAFHELQHARSLLKQ